MHAGGVQFDETGSLAEVVASGTQSAHLVSKSLERDSRNNSIIGDTKSCSKLLLGPGSNFGPVMIDN